MTTDVKPTLTPKLRFPEFLEAGAWRVEALGNICDILNNRRRPISSNQRSPGPYPYYGASGVVDHVGEFIFDERLLLVGEDGAKWEAFERTAFIAEGKYWVNNHAHVLKPIGVNDTLLESYLTMADLGPFVTGAAPPKLTLGKLKGIPIPVPGSPAEQQKIAECLSTLGELIGAESQKLDALKAHKKGLMQQLFPRKGESVPRLRFHGFRGGSKWKESPLSRLGEIFTGKTPSTKQTNLWGGDIQFITPTDISEDDKYQHTTTRSVFATRSTKVLPVGSIVYTCIASIGKMALTVSSSVTNQQINAVVPNEKILGEFLYYELVCLTPWIKSIPASSTLPIINKTEFSKIAILHPEDKDEQRRISACLSHLDELIAAQNDKLSTFKARKQGLMQQLFPSPVEAKA
jgi:type I restriction enzyme, S subunit